jgi:hypothetical protein
MEESPPSSPYRERRTPMTDKARRKNEDEGDGDQIPLEEENEPSTLRDFWLSTYRSTFFTFRTLGASLTVCCKDQILFI